MPNTDMDEFKEFWKWSILVTIDQIANNNPAIAREMFLPVMSNHDIQYEKNGTQHNRPQDDLATIAILVNASLIYLALEKTEVASSYIKKLSHNLPHDQMNTIRAPYYNAINKFVVNGYTKQEIQHFAKLAATEFRQLYAMITK